MRNMKSNFKEEVILVRKKFLFWLPALLLAWCLLPGLAWAAPTELDLKDDIEWGCNKLGAGWVSNEDFNDKVKLLVFYRTTCVNSQGTIRGLAQSDWAKDDRVQIIAVEITQAPDTEIESFKQRYAPNSGNIIFTGFTYAISDMWNNYCNKHNMGSLAHNFVIYDGKIRYAWEGGYSAKNYDDVFNALLSGQTPPEEKPGEDEKPEPADVTYKFAVDGQENYTEAYEVLRLLNEHRAANGLPALEMDERLLDLAMQRAAEQAVYYDHTRPDGTEWKTVLATEWPELPGLSTWAENIAMGYPTAANVMYQWAHSDGHNKNMLLREAKAVGIGCFENNGVKYWEQLFSSVEPQAATAQTGSKAATHDIEAVKELLDLQANPISLSLPKDGQAEVMLRNLNARDKRVVGIVRPSFGALTPEGVAKLDIASGRAKVQAVAPGKANLQLGVAASKEGVAPLTVNVAVTVNDTYTVGPDTKPSGGGGKRPSNNKPVETPKPEEVTKPAEPEKNTNNQGGQSGAALESFSDVRPGQWYSQAIDWVCQRGLMKGVSDDRFAPGEGTTRGMLVTMLFRFEGAEAGATAKFSDVQAGQWYSDAVAWASSNGVVSGFADGSFGPNADITREQLAAVLYRYAKLKGVDVSAQGDLSGFADRGEVAAWAEEPLQWAVGCGLLNGNADGSLDPAGNATRAQVAAILMRFDEKVAK